MTSIPYVYIREDAGQSVKGAQITLPSSLVRVTCDLADDSV